MKIPPKKTPIHYAPLVTACDDGQGRAEGWRGRRQGGLRPAEPASAHSSLCRPYQGNPTFDPEFIRSKSTAAAGLCSWCINIVRFYEVYCDVAPKRQALEEANAELAEAQEKLSRIKNKIAVSPAAARRRAPVPQVGAAEQGWRGRPMNDSAARGAQAAAGTDRPPETPPRSLLWELGRPAPPHFLASPCFPRNSTPT